jgi:hypothetical protein
MAYRHPRASEGPEGGEEVWMLACASMTAERHHPHPDLPLREKAFTSFVIRRLDRGVHFSIWHGFAGQAGE